MIFRMCFFIGTILISTCPFVGIASAQESPEKHAPLNMFSLRRSFQGLPTTPPGEIANRTDIGVVTGDDAARSAVSEVDGVFFGNNWKIQLFEFQNLGANCVVWTGLRGRLEYWDGSQWGSKSLQWKIARLSVLHETRFIVDIPPENDTFWVLLMGSGEGVMTDAVFTRAPKTSEMSSQRIIQRGDLHNNLGLSLWQSNADSSLKSGLCAQFQNVGNEELSVELSDLNFSMIVRKDGTENEISREMWGAGSAIISILPDNVSHVMRLGEYEPKESGQYQVALKYMKSGTGTAWEGTIQSNFVELEKEGWIEAQEAENAGKDDPDVQLTRQNGSVVTGEYTSGQWRYVILKLGGGRSACTSGSLMYNGLRVRTIKNPTLETPFGRLLYHGDKCGYLKGWLPVKISKIRILGSASVGENTSNTQYTCVADFTDDTSEPVNPDTWSIDCPVAATISTDGVLTTADVNANTDCVITATYGREGKVWSEDLKIEIKDL